MKTIVVGLVMAYLSLLPAATAQEKPIQVAYVLDSLETVKNKNIRVLEDLDSASVKWTPFTQLRTLLERDAKTRETLGLIRGYLRSDDTHLAVILRADKKGEDLTEKLTALQKRICGETVSIDQIKAIVRAYGSLDDQLGGLLSRQQDLESKVLGNPRTNDIQQQEIDSGTQPPGIAPKNH